MNHLDAAQIKGVERYLLGDLSVSEVEDFERHFFDCPQCSEELRALMVFQENARAVFLEQDLAAVPASATVPKSPASWRRVFSPLGFRLQWAGAFGALLIGLFAGYMIFWMRQGAQSISAYPLYAEARGVGEEPVITPKTGSKFYTLYLDRNWDADFGTYRAVVRSRAGGGGEKFTIPVTVGEPHETIYVLLPAQKLGSGQYVLVMQGIDKAGKEIALERYPFTVRFK